MGKFAVLNYAKFTMILIGLLFLISISEASARGLLCSRCLSQGIVCEKRYEIFINHRGADVKKTLAGHVYHRLASCGYEVFLDKPEIEPGDNIRSQIKGAIATARAHIAIFSPRYAESKWCLDELVRMLDSGVRILPVFYNMKPADLRRTSDKDGIYDRFLRNAGWARNNGGYAEALRNHERKNVDPERIAEWRRALSKVSYIAGLELKDFNSDEAVLTESIVQWVRKKIPKSQSDVPTHPTLVQAKL